MAFLPCPAQTAGEMKKSASLPSKHHSALCQICRHPDREEIDSEFLHWTHPEALAREYGLGSSRAVYRHAHARGLLEQRRERLRSALERIIEHVSEIKPTAAVILGAIRLIYQMDQKERERGSPESGSGDSKSGHSPVRFTIDSYPYFDDCFEPLPAEASEVQTSHPKATKPPEPASATAAAVAVPAPATCGSGRGDLRSPASLVPAPAHGAGRPAPTSPVGISPAAVHGGGSRERSAPASVPSSAADGVRILRRGDADAAVGAA